MNVYLKEIKEIFMIGMANRDYKMEEYIIINMTHNTSICHSNTRQAHTSINKEVLVKMISHLKEQSRYSMNSSMMNKICLDFNNRMDSIIINNNNSNRMDLIIINNNLCSLIHLICLIKWVEWVHSSIIV